MASLRSLGAHRAPQQQVMQHAPHDAHRRSTHDMHRAACGATQTPCTVSAQQDALLWFCLDLFVCFRGDRIAVVDQPKPPGCAA